MRGDTIRTEHRYAIGSSGIQTVAMFANASRNHWGSENGFQGTLDVVSREYPCRARKRGGHGMDLPNSPLWLRLIHSLTRFRRRALVTTETELSAMAAPAKTGDRSKPKAG